MLKCLYRIFFHRLFKWKLVWGWNEQNVSNLSHVFPWMIECFYWMFCYKLFKCKVLWDVQIQFRTSNGSPEMLIWMNCENLKWDRSCRPMSRTVAYRWQRFMILNVLHLTFILSAKFDCRWMKWVLWNKSQSLFGWVRDKSLNHNLEMAAVVLLCGPMQTSMGNKWRREAVKTRNCHREERQGTGISDWHPVTSIACSKTCPWYVHHVMRLETEPLSTGICNSPWISDNLGAHTACHVEALVKSFDLSGGQMTCTCNMCDISSGGEIDV